MARFTQIEKLEELIKDTIDGELVEQTVTPLLSPGENFGSVLYQVDFKVKNNGKEEEYHAVAKCTPPNPGTQHIFNTQITFKSEIAWYTTVIPTLKQFQKDNGVEQIADFFQKFYGARISLDPKSEVVDLNGVILTQNLKSIEPQIRLYKELVKKHHKIIAFKSNWSTIARSNHSFTVVTELTCDFLQFIEQAKDNDVLVYPNVWIVFGLFEDLKNMDYYIPVNTLVTVPIKNERRNITEVKALYKINQQFNGYIEEFLGYWTQKDKFHQFQRLTLTRNRTNFRRMILRVSYVIINRSTFKHLTDYREKHIDNLTKINYILFNFICDLLNTTQIEIIRSDWGLQSRLPTNEFTKGMLGDLIYDRADISGTLSFTPAYRLKYFKYIFAPLKKFSLKFIFRAPPLAYYSNLFILPFDKWVWFTILVLVIFGGIIIKLIFFWEGQVKTFLALSEENAENRPSLLDIVTIQIAIACQMDFFPEPRSLSGKLVTLVVLLSSTFLYTAFSARIVLLLQSSTNSIKTLEGLYNAKLDFGVEDQPFNRFYFTSPSDRSDEYWRQIIYENKMKLSKGDKFLQAAEGMRLVRDSYFAFHVEENVANYLIEKTFSNNQICSLKAVDTIFISDIPYLSCPRKSPYVDFFLVSFRRLSETGIHNREYKRCFTKQPLCLGKGNIFVSVGLIECYFPFAVLGAGICLSCSIFLIELMAARYLKGCENFAF